MLLFVCFFICILALAPALTVYNIKYSEYTAHALIALIALDLFFFAYHFDWRPHVHRALLSALDNIGFIHVILMKTYLNSTCILFFFLRPSEFVTIWYKSCILFVVGFNSISFSCFGMNNFLWSAMWLLLYFLFRF